jgi:hypothetical protein
VAAVAVRGVEIVVVGATALGMNPRVARGNRMMHTWTVLGRGGWTWPEALLRALLSCHTPRDHGKAGGG